MNKRILCAVDLTHEADTRALLEETGRIAKLDGAAITVVTVLPDYGSSWVGSFFKDGTLREAAEAAMKALHETAHAALPDAASIQCVVEIGTAYERILEVAATSQADLIIVGAHKPGLTDGIMGPNAARVVRYSTASVLVARLDRE